MSDILHKIVLIDGSGSMNPFEKETQDALRQIIENTQNHHHLTVVIFDDVKYYVLCDNLRSQIQPELAFLYKTCGLTPITDSIYKSIQDIATETISIEQLSEPHKFIIFTDGEENSSRYVSTEQCGIAIKHFAENFGWEFKFIGPKSSQDSTLAYANSLNIKSEDVTLFANVSDGLEKLKEISK